MSLLTLTDIYKTYHTGEVDVPVLKGVNLALQAGEKLAIVGQSGSGKSTLLHVTGLLDQPDQGEVLVDGQQTAGLSDKALSHLRGETFGFVYQQHHLMPDFTALENVLMPVWIKRRPAVADRARAQQLLARVGLEHRTHHTPSELSGGEMQRVVIARALMNQPKILLADEPTGNLDPKTASDVAALFDEIVAEQQMALLLVTHNPALAKTCDRVMTMVDGHLA